MLRRILEQKDLDPEVVAAIRLILCGKVETTSEDVRDLISVLCTAEDRDDLGWKVAGIVH